MQNFLSEKINCITFGLPSKSHAAGKKMYFDLDLKFFSLWNRTAKITISKFIVEENFMHKIEWKITAKQ